MAIRHLLAMFGAMLALPAQDIPERKAIPALQTTRILHCPDLARFDEAAPDQKQKTLTRLVEVLRHVPIGDAPARSLGLTIGNSSRGPMLLARGTTEQIDTVAAALTQLERADVGQTRLQISLVTVPLAVARAHRLEPGKAIVTDAVAWTELVRDAAKAKGNVHNLTEVVSGPLAPFAREVAANEGAPDRRPLRLRGEIVPVSGEEVALAVEIERGASRTGDKRAPSTVATPVFRLAAGKSAMMMAIDGDAALVVIARCLEVGVATSK